MGTDNVREGYYIEKKEMPGNPQYGNGQGYNIHVIHAVNPDGSLGLKWGVIGDTVLEDRMIKLSLGSYIRLEYKGRGLKKGVAQGTPFYKTNSYHVWDLGVDDNAIPYSEALKSSGQSEAPANTTVSNANVFAKANAQNAAPVNNAPVSNPFPENDDLPF